MTRYILDTGIVLGYLRGSGYATHIDLQYAPFAPQNTAAISVVTNGELRSLALQLHWGIQKQQDLKEWLRNIHQINIKNDAVLQMYAEIDAFSQGKLTSKKPPPRMSARNMGKNDIGIAATASIMNAILLTTDNDFDHLNGVFLSVIYVDPKTKP